MQFALIDTDNHPIVFGNRPADLGIEGRWVNFIPSPTPKTGVEELTYVLNGDTLTEIVGLPVLAKTQEQALETIDAQILPLIQLALGNQSVRELYAAKYQAAINFLKEETFATDTWLQGESDTPHTLAQIVIDKYEANQKRVAALDNLRITTKTKLRAAKTKEEVDGLIKAALDQLGSL